MTRFLGLVLLCACARDAERAAASAPLVTVAERGPHTVEVSLSPPAPRLADPLSLKITLEGPAEAPEPEFGLEDRFDVREARAEPVRLRDGRPVHAWTFTLEAKDRGAHTLGPFDVGGVETEPLTFEVASVIEGEPALAALKGPAGPVAIEAESSAPWWPWAAGALVLLALAALLLRRRRPEPERVWTPSELAAREFAALLADDPLARGEFSAFYSELTLIVRRYIERTTGIRAPELTTPEFLAQCRDLPKLGAFLEAADLVKFAAVRPGRAEVDDTIARAKEFTGLA